MSESFDVSKRGKQERLPWPACLAGSEVYFSIQVPFFNGYVSVGIMGNFPSGWVNQPESKLNGFLANYENFGSCWASQHGAN